MLSSLSYLHLPLTVKYLLPYYPFLCPLLLLPYSPSSSPTSTVFPLPSHPYPSALLSPSPVHLSLALPSSLSPSLYIFFFTHTLSLLSYYPNATFYAPLSQWHPFSSPIPPFLAPLSLFPLLPFLRLLFLHHLPSCSSPPPPLFPLASSPLLFCPPVITVR